MYHVEYVANKDSQSQAARGVMVRISLCAFLQSKTLDILFIFDSPHEGYGEIVTIHNRQFTLTKFVHLYSSKTNTSKYKKERITMIQIAATVCTALP